MKRHLAIATTSISTLVLVQALLASGVSSLIHPEAQVAHRTAAAMGLSQIYADNDFGTSQTSTCDIVNNPSSCNPS
jgi:hypothetical protein